MRHTQRLRGMIAATFACTSLAYRTPTPVSGAARFDRGPRCRISMLHWASFRYSGTLKSDRQANRPISNARRLQSRKEILCLGPSISDYTDIERATTVTRLPAIREGRSPQILHILLPKGQESQKKPTPTITSDTPRHKAR